MPASVLGTGSVRLPEPRWNSARVVMGWTGSSGRYWNLSQPPRAAAAVTVIRAPGASAHHHDFNIYRHCHGFSFGIR